MKFGSLLQVSSILVFLLPCVSARVRSSETGPSSSHHQHPQHQQLIQEFGENPCAILSGNEQILCLDYLDSDADPANAVRFLRRWIGLRLKDPTRGEAAINNRKQVRARREKSRIKNTISSGDF
jgi:hypothetical protein